MTYQDHSAALLAALRAAPGTPALVVYDGLVPPATTPPYVVMYVSFASPEPAADPASSDLTMASRRVDCWVYCHSVGANALAARAVAARVRGVLLDASIAVTARSSWPVRLVENQPPTRDEETGTPVFDQVDVYRLSTVPA